MRSLSLWQFMNPGLVAVEVSIVHVQCYGAIVQRRGSVGGMDSDVLL